MPDEDIPSIAVRAYQLWEAAGRPENRDQEFYYLAEDELRQMIEQPSEEYNPSKATASPPK